MAIKLVMEIKVKTEEYLKSEEFAEYAKAYYESKDYIEETLDTISGGYYSENNYSLLGMLIKETFDVYMSVKARSKEINDGCFEKYNGIEAVRKASEKMMEFDKVKIEALKLIYQIQKDLEQ